VVTPGARRQAAGHLQTRMGLSQGRAGRLVGIRNSSLRYKSHKPDEAAMCRRLKALAAERPRFGYRRLGVLLLREGTKVNHQRILRDGYNRMAGCSPILMRNTCAN
jgi:putative transposase